MKEYTIKMKEMEKPTVIGIVAFLADSEYVENTASSVDHMTSTLCYIGQLDEINATILKCNNIEKVLKMEIEEFYTNFNETITELKSIGKPEQVDKMVFDIETFIRTAISKRYD